MDNKLKLTTINAEELQAIYTYALHSNLYSILAFLDENYKELSKESNQERQLPLGSFQQNLNDLIPEIQILLRATRMLRTRSAKELKKKYWVGINGKDTEGTIKDFAFFDMHKLINNYDTLVSEHARHGWWYFGHMFDLNYKYAEEIIDKIATQNGYIKYNSLKEFKDKTKTLYSYPQYMDYLKYGVALGVTQVDQKGNASRYTSGPLERLLHTDHCYKIYIKHFCKKNQKLELIKTSTNT